MSGAALVNKYSSPSARRNRMVHSSESRMWKVGIGVTMAGSVSVNRKKSSSPMHAARFANSASVGISGAVAMLLLGS